MAKKKPVHGRCALCQEHQVLTFEHFPPKAVGNKLPVVVSEWQTFVRNPSEFGKRTRGAVQQKGSGWQVLCESCNNWQGRELVPEYLRWALPLRMAMESEGGLQATAMADSVARESIIGMELAGPFRPGRFARYALAACLLSTAQGDVTPPWQPQAAELVRQLEKQIVPTGFPRLFLSVCVGPLVGVHGIMVGGSFTSGELTTWYSSAYGRPFGFWLVDGLNKPGMLDITDWLEMDAEQSGSKLEVGGLVFGFSHLPFPGDLRSLAAIRSQADEPLELHPDFRGEHPSGGGAGITITVDDTVQETRTTVAIQIPGLWEAPGADDEPAA